MARGGRRKGAGRPKGTGKFGEPTKAVRLPISKLEQILLFTERLRLMSQPSVEQAAGIEKPQKPQVPFLSSMPDDSMAPKIDKGDLLTIDPTAAPQKGNVVLVFYHGCFYTRTYQPLKNRTKLEPMNAAYETIVDDPASMAVYGVVVNRVQKL